MKKYLIALVSLMACTTTFAQDNLQAQKLQIVKHIYGRWWQSSNFNQ